MKRVRRLPLRAGLIPLEGDYAITADHVIDDPRDPSIGPTGIFDERGQMLYRVTVPVKVKMGFALPTREAQQEEVSFVVAEDMLVVTDIEGTGLAYVDPRELELEEGDDDAE